MRDANDVLMQDGPEAVRRMNDEAKVYTNNALRVELESGLKSGSLLPTGYISLEGVNIEPPRDLIKGILTEQGVNLVVGQSGSGKSCIMASAARALATGLDWFGRKVRGPVGVLYYATEGYSSMARRLPAELKHHDIDEAVPIVLSRGGLNLSDDKQFAQFLRELVQVRRYFAARFGVHRMVVIIDTIAAAASLKDENSNAEVSGLYGRLRQIADHIEGLVIGVHHLGKNAEAGPRGASASRAAADQIISVLADRDESSGTVSNRRIVISKARDGEEGPIANFTLTFVELGIDEDDEPFGAVVAEPADGEAIRSQKKPTPAQKTFIAAFDEALSESGRDHEPMKSQDVPGPTVLAVPVEEVKEEFYRRWATGETDPVKRADTTRKAFKRALHTTSGFATEANDSGEELIWRT
jgi:hypothetical protein